MKKVPLIDGKNILQLWKSCHQRFDTKYVDAIKEKSVIETVNNVLSY